ncbi:MAG: YfbU family protein, partial [bacterium]
MALKLTRTERWILANQCRILEALYPKEARDFARDREALEHGFEGAYSDIIPHIYDESEGLSAEECSEVVQIMDMHLALKRSYEALADKSGIKEYGIKFQGFDGNNETAQMAY